MLPKFPVKIGFDIERNPDTRDVWAHPEARVLALLWRPCHIICDPYWEETLAIGKAIAAAKPRTVEDLSRVFSTRNFRHSNYTGHDVAEFVTEALPFFTGERQVEYEITTPNDTALRAVSCPQKPLVRSVVDPGQGGCSR